MGGGGGGGGEKGGREVILGKKDPSKNSPSRLMLRQPR